MNNSNQTYPVIDLHCDLLHYLATTENASPDSTDDIGCAIPYLKAGNVKLQVMAISSIESETILELTTSQIYWYKILLKKYANNFTQIANIGDFENVLSSDKTGIITAIENAAALCSDDEDLDKAFERLELIIKELGKPLYISLSHHGETRFGGGNYAKIGLKDDGRSLLDYLDNRKIAVDLSHTSDALAFEIIDYIDARGLQLPIIASHSNYRSIFDHPRNLPDELAGEIINRKGLIGVNFLRAFVHPDDPNYLMKHILYGLELGGENALCFGADYFCTKTHPDKSRIPFFFEPHENATKYQQILRELPVGLDRKTIPNFAYGNVLAFMQSV